MNLAESKQINKNEVEKSLDFFYERLKFVYEESEKMAISDVVMEAELKKIYISLFTRKKIKQNKYIF